MKIFQLNEFLDFVSLKYYNPEKDKINWKSCPFPACVYAFGDPWFYTVGDVFYSLRIMGFQIGFDGQHYYFIRVNPQICPVVHVGDRIIDIHYADGIASKAESTKQIKIDFLDILGTPQTAFIPTPVVTMAQHSSEYKIIQPHIVHIKISSFSNLDIQQIEQYLTDAEYLFIDLRNNMGGSVNDMLKVLSIFSSCSHYFKTEDSEGYIHSIRIERSYLNLSKLRAVFFLVNGQTASSAEMFLTMLRAIYPGQVFGEKTMGKFVIQDFVQVNDFHVAMPVYHFQMPEIRSGSAVLIDDCSRVIPDLQGLSFPIEGAFTDF